MQSIPLPSGESTNQVSVIFCRKASLPIVGSLNFQFLPLKEQIFRKPKYPIFLTINRVLTLVKSKVAFCNHYAIFGESLDVNISKYGAIGARYVNNSYFQELSFYEFNTPRSTLKPEKSHTGNAQSCSSYCSRLL